MKRLVLMLSILLLSACAGNPPYLSGPGLRNQMRAVAGMAAGVEVFESVAWHPFIRQGERMGTGWRGGLVLGDEAILFAIWDANLQRVEIAKRIPYAEVKAVASAGHGPAKLMVIRQRDGATHGFGFVAGAGLDVDPTERAVTRVRQRLSPGQG